MFASMNNLLHFGLLTGLTIIMALLADYFIAPALMVVVHRQKKIVQSSEEKTQKSYYSKEFIIQGTATGNPKKRRL
jgi:type IV secretory pathway VirB3-like protein